MFRLGICHERLPTAAAKKGDISPCKYFACRMVLGAWREQQQRAPSHPGSSERRLPRQAQHASELPLCLERVSPLFPACDVKADVLHQRPQVVQVVLTKSTNGGQRKMSKPDTTASCHGTLAWSISAMTTAVNGTHREIFRSVAPCVGGHFAFGDNKIKAVWIVESGGRHRKFAQGMTRPTQGGGNELQDTMVRCNVRRIVRTVVLSLSKKYRASRR